MMRFRQKTAYVLLGAVLVVTVQLLSNVIVNIAEARAGDAAVAANQVKYVFMIDYPVGKKGEYMEWVGSIAEALQAPAEVKAISSYDNYFSTSPERVVEFEFASMMDAMTYFEKPEIKSVLDRIVDFAESSEAVILQLRSDYSKN